MLGTPQMIVYTQNAEENLLDFLTRRDRRTATDLMAIRFASGQLFDVKQAAQQFLNNIPLTPTQRPLHRVFDDVQLLRAFCAEQRMATSCEAFFCCDGDIVFICKQIELSPTTKKRFFTLFHNLLNRAASEDDIVFFTFPHDYFGFSQMVNEKMVASFLHRVQVQQTTDIPNPNMAYTPDIAPVTARKMVSTAKKFKQWHHPHLVIAETDPVIKRKIHQMFAADFHISYMNSSADLIELYLNNAPDLVMVSNQLPHVSGIDLIRHIQEWDAAAFSIVLSHQASEQDVKKALAYGAKGFLLKPFDEHRLQVYMQQFHKNWQRIRNQHMNAAAESVA